MINSNTTIRGKSALSKDFFFFFFFFFFFLPRYLGVGGRVRERRRKRRTVSSWQSHDSFSLLLRHWSTVLLSSLSLSLSLMFLFFIFLI